NWHKVLWRAISRRIFAAGSVDPQMLELMTMLAGVMDKRELDVSLTELLRHATELPALPFEVWADHLSAPWSQELSEIYLHATRRLFQSRADFAATRWCG